MSAVSVLHVCDKFGVAGSSIHGVSRLFSWWFPRFDSARFDVSLVGLKSPEPASELLRSQGVPVTHLGRGKFDPRILTDLVKIARQREARVLHLHGYAAADFGRLAARQVGAAVVLHEHFADPKMPAYQALADRLLSGLTDRAVAVSGSTAEFLVRERFVPRDRVRLIWNGAPLDDFAPRSEAAAAAVRGSLGIPPQARLVGAIGRLNAQKGHRHLIQAAAQVLAARSDVHFLLVGDGDLRSSLEAQAQALGIRGSITFAGHRADVAEILSGLDVFCLSSLYEGTPLALFEAMASSRAIVSTAVDGCREVLRDGENGLLVAPGDSRALGAALLRVLGDDALRASLARAALSDSRLYDVAECVRQLEAVYDDVLRERACR